MSGIPGCPGSADRTAGLSLLANVQLHDQSIGGSDHFYDLLVLDSERLPNDTFYEHERSSTYEAFKNSISSWFRSCFSSFYPFIPAQIREGSLIKKNRKSPNISFERTTIVVHFERSMDALSCSGLDSAIAVAAQLGR